MELLKKTWKNAGKLVAAFSVAAAAALIAPDAEHALLEPRSVETLESCTGSTALGSHHSVRLIQKDYVLSTTMAIYNYYGVGMTYQGEDRVGEKTTASYGVTITKDGEAVSDAMSKRYQGWCDRLTF